MSDGTFEASIREGYAFQGETLLLGAPLLDGKIRGEARVRVPIAMMNRHGLIAGATGNGTAAAGSDYVATNGTLVFARV